MTDNFMTQLDNAIGSEPTQSDGSDSEPIDGATVDGAELLNDIEQFAGQYLALPTKHHVVVLTLWAAHTWAVSAFYVTPRLILDSPEPGCAKTRVLEVLALVCHTAKLTLSTTTAALYRRIAAAGDHPPTVLQDEADAVFGKTASPQAEDLRALFNSGYKRGATVDRCEGDGKKMKVREFPVFAPVALAGLAGKVPKTIIDRGVVFHMRHRAADEHISEFRERDANVLAEPLRKQLEAWAESNFAALAAARPVMPDGVCDRPAEIWEALIAVADIAGGDWPQRAREACEHFVVDVDENQPSLGIRLLGDLRKLFNDRKTMFSVDIITALTDDEESEWGDLWGKPLDQRRLANELRKYGVQPRMVRSSFAQARGYRVDGEDGLAQAWRHYLDSAPMRTNRTERTNAGQSDIAAVPDPYHPYHDDARYGSDRTVRTTSVPDETCSEQPLSDDGTAGTPGTHIDGSLAGADVSAAYVNGMCRDCKDKPRSAGRPRCDTCHRIWQTTARGYDQ